VYNLCALLISARKKKKRGKTKAEDVECRGLIFSIIVNATWVTTNGILLYAMKKPNDGGRPESKSLNRTEKRPGTMNFACLTVIPPLNAIDDGTTIR